MLRVRLDACEIADDRVWFDGALLTGVGAEVAGRDDPVLSEGTVLLWEYVEGQRLGRWVEPDFGGDQQFMLDSFALDQAQSDPKFEYGIEDFYTLDGQDFTGVVVLFDGPHLRGFEWLIDGYAQAVLSVYWSSTGELDHYENRYVVPWRDHAMQVREVLSIGQPFHNSFTLGGAQRVRHLGFTAGRVRLGPGYGIEPFLHTDPQRIYTGFTIDTDGEGRVCALKLYGESFFEVGEQVRSLVALRGDHVFTLADVSNFFLAPVLRVDVPQDSLVQIVEALGGFDAFGVVEHLALRPQGLSRDVMERIAELPGLKSMDIEWLDMGLELEVFAERRPDVLVTNKGQTLDELRQLSLRPEGMSRGFLERLAQLPALESVVLYSAEPGIAFEVFTELRPELRIRHRSIAVES